MAWNFKIGILQGQPISGLLVLFDPTKCKVSHHVLQSWVSFVLEHRLECPDCPSHTVSLSAGK
jgi:hypothetical protein